MSARELGTHKEMRSPTVTDREANPLMGTVRMLRKRCLPPSLEATHLSRKRIGNRRERCQREVRVALVVLRKQPGIKAKNKCQGEVLPMVISTRHTMLATSKDPHNSPRCHGAEGALGARGTPWWRRVRAAGRWRPRGRTGHRRPLACRRSCTGSAGTPSRPGTPPSAPPLAPALGLPPPTPSLWNKRPVAVSQIMSLIRHLF